MSDRPSAHLLFGFEINSNEPAFPSTTWDLDCDLIIVGSGDDTRYFVAALSIEDIISDDGPVSVDLPALQLKEADARRRLAEYCTKYGISPREPSWRLAAAYN